MFKQWINWLKGDAASDPVNSPQQRRRVSAHAALHARSVPAKARTENPDNHEIGPTFEGRIENVGPGKNVLISDADEIDDTGARETLRQFDDAPLDPREPRGIDPYNSGQFDRSKNWDTRFRD